jgi:hypothetical protein
MTEKSKPEKLSGIDHLTRSLFRALGINAEELKHDFETRVAAFEQGLHLLNFQLQTLSRNLEEIKHRQYIQSVLIERICKNMEIETCVEMPIMENDSADPDQRRRIEPSTDDHAESSFFT